MKVKVMSEDDLPEWYRKRKKRNPFFGNWFFRDIGEMMREMAVKATGSDSLVTQRGEDETR